MSLPDTIFIFGLALVIFGPRKLPEIGRQLGKLLYEFRRASNEFKMQIDEELRSAEQADRQKQLAASVTPVTPAPAEEALVVRPPSDGVIVSTESPAARVIPVQDEAAELEKVGENHPEMTASNGLHKESEPEQATTHHD
jgi:sec-independent protein translocase protein TatB